MNSNVMRFVMGTVVALLIAGVLVSPLGSARAAAAQSDVAPGDTVCAPTKGQPRLADLVVAGQTPDGTGVYVKNIGCYATTNFFEVRVTVTDGTNFASEYVPVLQFIQPDGSVIIPVGFDCDLSLARIEVDIDNSVFELNEHNNIGNAISIIC
ncbi:MAG TPA: hypothetical protein VH482_33385 [Thermomicrobiales bacterium]